MIKTGPVYGNSWSTSSPPTQLLDRGSPHLATGHRLRTPPPPRLLAEAGSVKTAIAMHKLHLDHPPPRPASACPRLTSPAALSRQDPFDSCCESNPASNLGRMPSPLPKHAAFLVALLLLLAALPGHMQAYSVLTHEQMIDLTWHDTIVRFCSASIPTSRRSSFDEAHAYAYGGCAIQDLGYYPSARLLQAT